MTNVRKRNLLWLGSIFDQTTTEQYRAVSPAANRWQKGLIDGLSQLDQSVTTLGHMPEPSWPKGQLKIDEAAGTLAASPQGHLVDYWNLPYGRNISLAGAYLQQFNRLCKMQGLPRAIISYNLHPAALAVALSARRHKVPCVSIIADMPNNGFTRVWHQKALEVMDGRVFLSWSLYNSFNKTPKLHLDGGVESTHALKAPTKNAKSIILYTGTFSKYGGIDALVKGFQYVKHPNTELWLCGKGRSEIVDQIASRDPRIRVFGFVSEERLKALTEAATVFVNPRPTYLLDNRNNFPSKIMEYLYYGKPTISTWTEGLSPEYRDILVVLENESPQCLGDTLDNTLGWSESQISKYQRRVFEFLKNEKTWVVQAQRFVDWLEQDVIHSEVIV